MKKISILLISALFLGALFIFASCDQSTVDSARTELMDVCVDLLGPYFREATETTGSGLTDPSTADTGIYGGSDSTTDRSDYTVTSVVIDVSSMF